MKATSPQHNASITFKINIKKPKFILGSTENSKTKSQIAWRIGARQTRLIFIKIRAHLIITNLQISVRILTRTNVSNFLINFFTKVQIYSFFFHFYNGKAKTNCCLTRIPLTFFQFIHRKKTIVHCFTKQAFQKSLGKPAAPRLYRLKAAKLQ